jgi:hypothetical protein
MTMRKLIVLLFFVALGALVVFAPSRQIPPTPEAREAEAIREAVLREEAAKDAELRKHAFAYRWETGGFGSVLLVTFTLTNPTIYPWRDLHVACDLIAETGRVIGTKSDVLYVIVPAHGKKTVERFNLGFISQQVYGPDCRLDGMTWGKPDELAPADQIMPTTEPVKAKKAARKPRAEKGV